MEVALQHLPGPIFVAYIAPALAAQGLKGLVAALAVVAAQALTRNLAVAIGTGVAVMWAAGMLA